MFLLELHAAATTTNKVTTNEIANFFIDLILSDLTEHIASDSASPAVAAARSRTYTSAPVVRSLLGQKTIDNKRQVGLYALDQKGEIANVTGLKIW